jgi:hypothetical protein
MLARKGSAVIQQLRNAAAGASRHGRVDTAATLLRMAEAAEREWQAIRFGPK